MIRINIDIKAFRKITNGFAQRFQAQLAAAAMKAGDVILKEIVTSWNSNAYGWRENEAKWRKQKADKGFSTRPLIRSDYATRKVKTVRQGFGGWVGLPGGLAWPEALEKMVRHHTTPHRIPSFVAATIAGHERGEMHGPPRPLFQPAALNIQVRVRSIYEEALQKALAA